MISSRPLLRGPVGRPLRGDAGTALILVALVVALVRCALVAWLPYDRVVGLFDDDAFYYLGVARNVAEGAGSTFNGLDPTNGYHPLWLAVLVPVSALADGRGALLLVTLLSGVVLVATTWLLVGLGRRSGRVAAHVVAASPLLVTGAAGPSFFFSGMETGLLLLGLTAVAAVVLAWNGEVPSVRSAAVAGLLMGATVLARLDAVFPLAVLGLVLAVQWRRRPRSVLALAGPPASLLGAYTALNAVSFGTAVPVSGQAKSLGGGGVRFGTVVQFLTSPVLFGTATYLGAVALVVVAVVGLLARRAGGPVDPLLVVGASYLVGAVLTVLWYATTSSWQLWPWYFSTAPLVIALVGPELAARAPRARTVLLAGSLVVVLAVVAVGTVRTVRGGVVRSAFIEAGPAVAARLEQVTPPGAAVAMGDRAGSVGWHLDRPVVQLEGLVESVEYLDALETGTVPDYLAERGVEVYVRADASVGEPVGDGCRRFVEPQQGAGPKTDVVVCDEDLLVEVPVADGTAYRAWRWEPALQHR